ncbi:MAG: nitrate ABC transporter permease [Acidiphilium sp. 37-64-53]|uniref:ABC transporter permease n=1 Tax=Acidiphilium TaxID=522 RepID=UPI000BC5FB23|nr:MULTISPECIES: ABC transporter permease [Acidiphilium]OYW00874.1 MAG: nitrate ABC transporter permease [Acidiphilium sp. 37-64-53]OZB27442.1 MAG: nitrate ABC transporter permease [Acidiphilium sp. 34-64-41]HQT86329.1 ABC transporter permease [Acidiphilium rubrum]
MSVTALNPTAPRRDKLRTLRDQAPVIAGVIILLGLWWLGGALLRADPATKAFAGFAPAPAFAALIHLAATGALETAALASLARVAGGLAIAITLGVPIGIAIGRIKVLKQATSIPFQFLRMISPLSWMPIAVLVFPGWNGAIVFLIVMAAVWPIIFATANGVSKIDPAWLKVARNLRATPLQRLRAVILPAIAQDVMTGIRLALGVAWIVLVPAEYLGVSSGLGYAISDARDTLDYPRLAAIVLTIGLIGFTLDSLCTLIIRRVIWQREG